MSRRMTIEEERRTIDAILFVAVVACIIAAIKGMRKEARNGAVDV